jgi:hypothetical protein
VTPFRTGHLGEATNFRLNVEFSYPVGGSEHSGQCSLNFRSEQEALELQQSLHQGPFYVRHNPLSPAEYVVDPYRDVWFPQAPPQVSTDEAVTLAAKGEALNRKASPVSLGKLFISQVVIALILYAMSARTPMIFWFLAAGHAAAAITTTGCLLWTTNQRTLPTWVGRVALIVVACAWLLAARIPR